MIFGRYYVSKRTGLMRIELMNQPKTKRGWTNANATFHIENSIRKHVVIDIASIEITVMDRKNPYLMGVAGALAAFARGVGLENVKITVQK
jgi:hypothetical protein